MHFPDGDPHYKENMFELLKKLHRMDTGNAVLNIEGHRFITQIKLIIILHFSKKHSNSESNAYCNK